MDIDHLSPEEMPAVRDRILAKKDELGLRMLEESARGFGYHLVFARKADLSQEQNLKWASDLLNVAYDKQAKDITRVFFTTSADQLLYLDDGIFEVKEVREVKEVKPEHQLERKDSLTSTNNQKSFPTQYHGIPFDQILKKYWEVNNQGYEPTEGDRDTLTYQLACDLRHICGKNADWLDQVIPCYDGFTPEEKRAKINNALTSEYNGFPQRLRNTLNALQTNPQPLPEWRGVDSIDGDDSTPAGEAGRGLSIKKLPQGIRDSIDAVGPQLAMPIVTAICPCIGALATGVKLDVHGTRRGLNLISYIAGDFASGKGGIDPVVEAWMSEVAALDKMYQQQEEEWRAKKRAAKNQKNQPEEPKLPVRWLRGCSWMYMAPSAV
jgi:hypothetical protein